MVSRSFLSRSIKLMAILMMFMHPALTTAGEDLPPSWPWQGVTMNQNATEAKDIQALSQKLKVNSVRLTLRPRSLAKIKNVSPEIAWRDTLDWAASMLDGCKQNNLVCTLSLSQFPIDPTLGYKQTSPEFWNDPQLLSQVVSLSEALAKRFHNRGTELGAYQILNEPLVRGDRRGRPPNWSSLIRKIVDGIRRYDPDRYICIAAGPGGSPKGIRTFEPLNRKRLIYTAHMYSPHSFTHQGIQGRPKGNAYPGKLGRKVWNKDEIIRTFSHLRNFEQKHNALIYISEFSAARWAQGAEQYLLDVADVMASYGWSYAYHSWGGYHAWSPFYNNTYSAGKPAQTDVHRLNNTTPRLKTLQLLFNSVQTSEDRTDHSPMAVAHKPPYLKCPE